MSSLQCSGPDQKSFLVLLSILSPNRQCLRPMSVLPQPKKGGTKGQGKGRKEWVEGEKLYDNMVLHTGGQFLKKYAAPPVQDDGRSTAIYEALGEPHTWATPDGLVEKMSSRSTELTNRRSVGLSEAAGTLESLNQAIVDASLPVKAVWCELWSKNDMSTTCPDPQLARVPRPGALARGNFSTELHALLNNPGSWRLLRDFLAKECSHLATMLSSTALASGAASSTAGVMTFSDDEAEAEQSAAQRFQEKVTAFMALAWPQNPWRRPAG